MSIRSTSSVTATSKFERTILVPTVVGIVAALGMSGIYLVILTLFQGFWHAIQQASQDWFWIGMVSIGFGAQIGLYAHLRLLVRAAKAMNATVATGVGTTTSTLGMLAGCAHHLIDVVPFIALSGASSLAGAIVFLSDWRYAFIALGLAVNAVSIVVTLRTIRKAQAHSDAIAVIQSFNTA